MCICSLGNRMPRPHHQPPKGQQMLNFLPGKKTYVIGSLMIAWGLASALLPDLGMMPMAEDPARAILEGMGLLGLRKAIS